MTRDGPSSVAVAGSRSFLGGRSADEKFEMRRGGRPRLLIYCCSICVLSTTVLSIHKSSLQTTRHLSTLSSTTEIVTEARGLDPVQGIAEQSPARAAALPITNRAAGLAVCPDALPYFTMLDAENSISNAIEFHMKGGNLKSVQIMKDEAIDSTLQKLGVEFILDGEKTATKNLRSSLNRYYARNPDTRGGYGRPLPGKYSNHQGTKMLWENRWFEASEETNSRRRWEAALGPGGPNCTRLVQLGKRDRAGGDTKWICRKEVRNREQQRLSSPFGDDQNDGEECHVLSIGGNDNWAFEAAVVDTLPGNCTTHTFDCTLPNGRPQRKPDRPDIRFYNYCIDGRNHTDVHGRRYLTYHDILNEAGLNKAPTLLKLDVEGFEYDIFSQLIQHESNRELLPLQIQVELHWATRMTAIDWMPRQRTSGEIALFAGMMFTGGGYLPIQRYWHPGCASCMEVLYFRVAC